MSIWLRPLSILVSSESLRPCLAWSSLIVSFSCKCSFSKVWIVCFWSSSTPQRLLKPSEAWKFAWGGAWVSMKSFGNLFLHFQWDTWQTKHSGSSYKADGFLREAGHFHSSPAIQTLKLSNFQTCYPFITPWTPRSLFAPSNEWAKVANDAREEPQTSGLNLLYYIQYLWDLRVYNSQVDI